MPLAFRLAQLAFLATFELDSVLVNVPCYSVPPQSICLREALLYHKCSEIRLPGRRPVFTLKTFGKQV